MTEDKDAKQTPGYIFNPRTEEIRFCSGFGKIELITKLSASGSKTYKIDGIGRAFFYYQVVVGDPVDTYHPFPKIISAYRFFNEFKEITSDKDAWLYVITKYKENYFGITEWVDFKGEIHKGSWIDILQAYVDVVHMRRWFTPKIDRIDVRAVLKKMELLDD